MNRTIFVVSLVLAVAGLAAQSPAPAPPAGGKPQTNPITELEVAMRAAESRLKTVAITMHTEGRFVEGFTAKSTGVLHVVRGEQSAIHTRFEFDTGDGMRGRCESAQTATGLLWFEDSAVSGEVFVQLDAKVIADLEWAGRVLGRDDVPGMTPRSDGDAPDRRTTSPLGSAVVTALGRQFDLAIGAKTERNGEAGTWLVGSQKKGLDVQDPGLPAADRVELFVRTRDLALLEMRQLEGERVVQLMVIDALVVDGEIPAKTFQIDGGGQRALPVQKYPPLWEQIELACLEAEVKSIKDAATKNEKLPPAEQVKPEVRPSKR